MNDRCVAVHCKQRSGRVIRNELLITRVDGKSRFALNIPIIAARNFFNRAVGAAPARTPIGGGFRGYGRTRRPIGAGFERGRAVQIDR